MTNGECKLLRKMFDAAVAAAAPSKCIPAHLPPLPSGRTLVVGGGKAAASMARVVEDHWQGALAGLPRALNNMARHFNNVLRIVGKKRIRSSLFSRKDHPCLTRP